MGVNASRVIGTRPSHGLVRQHGQVPACPAPPRDEAPPPGSPDGSGTSIVTPCDPAAFPVGVASTAPRHGSPPRCGRASRMPFRSAGLISWLAWGGACRCTFWASRSSRTTGQNPASLLAAREAADDLTTVLPDVAVLPSEFPGAVVAGGTDASLGATLQPQGLRDACDSQLHAAIPSTNATPILSSWRHVARNSPLHASRNPCMRWHGVFSRQDAKRTCLFTPRRWGVRREPDTQELLARGSGCGALPCGP